MDEQVSVIASFLKQLMRPGLYVNFGIGIPTLCMERLRDAPDLMVHTENGVLGAEHLREQTDWDGSTITPGKTPMGLRFGASCFDSLEAFAMIRGGHLDLTVMGAYEVSMAGDLANWWRPGARQGGIGGAADLAVGAREVWVTMRHTSSSGRPKLVERCEARVTAHGVVNRVITELGVLEPRGDHFRVTSLAAGVTAEEIRNATGALIQIEQGAASSVSRPRVEP